MSTIGQLTAGLGLDIGPLQKGAIKAASDIKKMSTDINASIDQINRNTVRSLIAPGMGNEASSVISKLNNIQKELIETSRIADKTSGKINSSLASVGGGSIGSKGFGIQAAINSLQGSGKSLENSLNGAISNSEKGFRNLSGTATSELSKVSSAFQATSAIIQGSLMASLGAVAVKTIQVSGEFERLEVKLNALTKGRGTETLDELNKWAMVMPVNTMKAVDTFTMMLAMGLNPTIDKMTTLVDVSVLFGEEAMTSVARALGQMQQLGKVSYQELMQFANAGINVRKYLVDAFGMSIEELQKSGKDITEITNAVLDGLKKEFGGAAAEASKSWTGVKETFFSMIDEVARKGGEADGSFDGLKDALRGVTKVIVENQDTLVQLASSTVKFTGDLVSLGSVILGTAMPAIDVFGKGLDGLRTFFQNLGLWSAGLNVAFADTKKIETDPYLTVIKAQNDKLEAQVKRRKFLLGGAGIVEVGQNISKGVKDAEKVGSDFVTALSNPIDSVKTAWNNLSVQTKDVREEFIKSMDAFFVTPSLSGMVDSVVKPYNDALDDTIKKEKMIVENRNKMSKEVLKKSIESDFDFFVSEAKKPKDNLFALQRNFANSPMSSLIQPKEKEKKEKGSKAVVNLNAQVDLAKDLDWHFREIVGDISAEEKALKAVDAIIDRQVKDLKAIGLGEKDILKIRTQAHQKELAILKSKEEMADVVKKVKELEKGGMIYGDDYGTLKEGEQSQWSVKKELDEEALEKFVDLADEIGASFADAFLTGFEGGLDGLGDVLKGVLEDQVFSSISKSISKSVQNSLSNSKFLSSFGPALGSIAGGVVGAGLGEIGKMITGSSKSDQKRKEERALIKELYHNTKATERNTARLVAGETSSYTSPLSDITAGFQDMAVDLREKFKGGLSFGLGGLIRDLEGSIGSMKINVVFKSMLEGFENGFSNINSMISEFSKMSDVDNLHNKTKAGLNSIIASLEEFAAEIDNVQKDIFKSLRASWEAAGDAFRTEGEVSRRGMEEAGKDYLLGLAETFKLEGTSIGTEWKELFGGIKLPQTKYMDDSYIEELSKLTSVQEISQKLLKDLIPGTDAYNKAMEASLIIYETSRLKAKETQTDILASVNDMWVSTADTFKTEAQRTQEEVEKQGREFLLGLADSYGLDVKDLDKLKNVNEITNQLLKDLVPGTEEYNQVMEASVKIYDTAIMKQKSMVSGLESSISSWKDDLTKRNWGKSEWVGEFETIGRSIEGLNVLSDTYFSDALSLSEKQFDALKQIVSFSEAQLLELQNSSKSLSEQLWEFSKGGEADAISSKDWMSRGEGLYLTAEKTLNPEDIQEFQQFLPELRDAMLSAGYSNSYVTEQFQWALSTLLDKVNVAMADVESNIDKLPELAPSVQTQQPIQIMLNVDGKQLSNVIIDQLNTNTNLIKAVQRID